MVMDKESAEGNLVWYANYGSNLSRDRFLCYIRGGTPKGSEKYCSPCADDTLRCRDAAVAIPYQLYFAEHGSGWDGGGIAYIYLSKTEENATLGRMILSPSNNLKRW